MPAIHKYAEEGLHTELAVSLNASTDEQRRRLMPGVARWPLEKLLEACRHFTDAHAGRPVTFAYVLIEEVNDLFDDQMVWYGLDLDVFLGRRWFLLLSAERTDGDFEEVDQYYTRLSYRF